MNRKTFVKKSLVLVLTIALTIGGLPASIAGTLEQNPSLVGSGADAVTAPASIAADPAQDPAAGPADPAAGPADPAAGPADPAAGPADPAAVAEKTAPAVELARMFSPVLPPAPPVTGVAWGGNGTYALKLGSSIDLDALPHPKARAGRTIEWTWSINDLVNMDFGTVTGMELSACHPDHPTITFTAREIASYERSTTAEISRAAKSEMAEGDGKPVADESMGTYSIQLSVVAPFDSVKIVDPADSATVSTLGATVSGLKPSAHFNLEFKSGENVISQDEVSKWLGSGTSYFVATWGSTNPQVASVDLNGNIEAHAKGTTSISYKVQCAHARAVDKPAASFEMTAGRNVDVDRMTVSCNHESAKKAKVGQLIQFTLDAPEVFGNEFDWDYPGGVFEEVETKPMLGGTIDPENQRVITLKVLRYMSGNHEISANYLPETAKLPIRSNTISIEIEQPVVILTADKTVLKVGDRAVVQATCENNFDHIVPENGVWNWGAGVEPIFTKAEELKIMAQVSDLGDVPRSKLKEIMQERLVGKPTVTFKVLDFSTDPTRYWASYEPIRRVMSDTADKAKKSKVAIPEMELGDGLMEKLMSEGGVGSSGGGTIKPVPLPSADSFKGGKVEFAVVKGVTDITASPNPVTLEVGNAAVTRTMQLSKVISPADATNPLVKWTSSNPLVAEVDANGFVRALAVGTSTISVTTVDGGLRAEVLVTVVEKNVVSPGGGVLVPATHDRGRDNGPVVNNTVIVLDDVTPLGALNYINAYVSGYPDKSFKPSNNLTRAEAACLFARLMSLDTQTTEGKGFDDVSKIIWYSGAVNAVAKVGVINGYSDNTFKPNEYMTRADLALAFAKYWENHGIKVNDASCNAADIKGHAAEKAINQVVNAKLMTTLEGGLFKPNTYVTRDQAIALINKMIARAKVQRLNPTFKDVKKEYWASGDIEAAASNQK